MNTLIIDTSHNLLVVGLAINGVLVESFQDHVSKKHSEQLLIKVKSITENNNITPNQINEIVVTDGPGSYTGMRIGITFVKTFALTNTKLKIYKIDTLLSLSGLSSGFALLDARSKRVFGAYVENGIVNEERVYNLDELNLEGLKLFGDSHLIDGRDSEFGDISQNILSLRDKWTLVDNIDVLVPRYIK